MNGANGWRLKAWYVVGQAEGVMRREDTKVECLTWAKGKAGSDEVLPDAKRVAPQFYEYYIGADRETRQRFLIVRGDAAQRAQYDLEQEPLYPHRRQPYERGGREAG